MARQVIDIGVQGNDGTGDSIRESFRKVNENFVQLFAIFGSGDTIAFTDLDDTPDSYEPDQVFVANSTGDALIAKSIVGGEGIDVYHGDENEIRIISTGGKVGNDENPSLGSHLNAQNFGIGNLAEPDDDTAVAFNAKHGTAITADDLVITKGYADQRYLQATGGPGTGSQIRVRDEPIDTSEYTLVISSWNNGYAVIPDHGFNSGSNGISYRYTNTGSVPASGLIKGQTYYLRYINDKNKMAVYGTQQDAIDNTNRIVVNDPEISSTLRGTETFIDANYDETLEGNWVSNEALPRKSVVRRQGDTMDGTLILADHPGSLAGAGSPNGPDDLQAATKYYVDNSSFASDVNLFVATGGDDAQTNTPAGKEGRAFAYAYSSVNAACQRAEELINSSLTEPGPYRQVLTYGNNANIAYLSEFTTGSGTRRTLKIYTNSGGVDQSKDPNNRDLREGSIIKGLRSGATARVISYDYIVGLNDVYQVELLHTIADKTYFQSDYKYASANLENNKDFIVAETVEYVKAKYPSLEFDEVKCARDAGLIVDALAFDVKFGGNIKSIKAAKAYWNGVVSVLPVDQKAQTVDAIEYINLLAQEIIDNTVIANVAIPDTLGVLRRSEETQYTAGEAGEYGSDTAIARLIDSITNIVGSSTGTGNGTLLEFLPHEHLEFGQPVPEMQITIRVESGVYYEQLPIRVPTNVSIKGDEFRRSIIRPAPGQSTSPWASIYFYRDDEFDNLTRTYSGTGASSSFVAADADYPGSPAYWKVTVGSVTGLEVGMYVTVTSGTGTFAPASQVTRIISTTSFEVNHSPVTPLSGATIRGLNSSGLAPTGNKFGYHYLTDPTGISGIFDDSILKTSGNTIAAGLLNSNKNFIKQEVIEYINAKYGPTFAASYNQILCARDVGYIVDALVYDLTNGGTSRTVAAGQSYSRNASARIAVTTQLTETLDGINYINELSQLILFNTAIGAPSVSSGSGATVGKRGTTYSQVTGGTLESNTDSIVADLINGVENTIIGTNNPPKANKDMDVFLCNDGVILRNITAQGHGGFMCVLDPEGQIQTKSPYFQTCTSLSGSVNKQRFSGGMLIDGFSGNLPARIISKNSDTELVLDGLIVRQPGVPNSFYINGVRYQLNAVEDYDRSAGTATITLDEGTPYLSTVTTPIDIIIETPGNRSMLANDFTQINDLGYGIVATNNGISEAVSVFTYYNWASYYAVNGGQIRSLNGSSCNGVYGLKASGSDPNEVPDPVTLADGMLQAVRTYKRDAFAGKNIAGDQSVYIDYYSYADGTTQPSIYNVSEIEIDHSNTKSSVVENTPTAPNNISIVAGGLGYSKGDLVDVNNGASGVLYTGGLKTRFRVTEIDSNPSKLTGAPGVATKIEVIEVGTYSVNPVGGYPTVSGVVSTTNASGSGSGLTVQCTFLGAIETYEISNLELTTSTGLGLTSVGGADTRTVLKLNLNTESGDGLKAPLEDDQPLIIRGLQNFRFLGVERVKPVRPSTAVEFTAADEAGSVYRTLSYNLSFPTGQSLFVSKSISTISRSASVATITTVDPHGLITGQAANITCTTDNTFDAIGIDVTVTGLNTFTYTNAGTNVSTVPASGVVTYSTQAILTFDQSYDYVIFQTSPGDITTTDPDDPTKTMGANAGDTKIAVVDIATISTLDRINSGNKVFIWDGRMHLLTGYEPAASGVPSYVTFTDIAYGEGTIFDPASDPEASGIRSGFTTSRSTTLRAGLQAGEDAEITVNISTCRATGHDFLDIGSGGFNSTNYPNNLLGAPVTAPIQAQEVVEETQGRVFYVSTDQFGIFRVGKFFTVDQGTGTVTFSASIALSNLDGIGFKRGTVVKEFSTDSTMTDNADDAVPVESAVRGYIDKRLGYTHTGALVPLAERIPVGTGGFLPISGSPTLEADLTMGSTVGHRIKNLVPDTTSSSDAANIGYVDLRVAEFDSLYKLKETLIMTPDAGDIAVFTGAGRTLASSTIGGDINATMTSTNVTTLVGGITTAPTVDSGIIGTAQTNVNGGIVVADITGFPASGYIQIGEEIFSYTSITSVSNRFDGVTREAIDTTASIHLTGASVISLSNAKLDLQIANEIIVNDDVSPTAAIAQSKIDLVDVTDFVDIATTSAIGIASFSSDNFDVSAGGEVTIKDSGVSLVEIQNISAGSILGNLGGSAAAPQEVSTSGIVENGVNDLFDTIDLGSSVMTRRVNGLSLTCTFNTYIGTPPTGSDSTLNVPLYTVSGTGNGARATISWGGGTYSTITITYGGYGYSEGDQLFVPGSLIKPGVSVDGAGPAGNDFYFTVASTGTNIDTNTYLGLMKTTVLAEANSIVRTDSNRNLGGSYHKFNNVYATTFVGALTGNVSGNATSATTATNLAGITVGADNIIGSIPYQSGDNATTLLRAGTAGRYLKSQGAGNPPVWSEVIIPDGDANSLTGTTLASNVVNSSLTSVGTLTSLTVGTGNFVINTDKFKVFGNSGNTNVGGNLTVSGLTALSTNNAVTAAGINQGTATEIEHNINIVSSAGIGTGVRLPDAVAGYRILIKNVSSNNILIYPNAGGRVNDNLINDPVLLEVNTAFDYFCSESSSGGLGGQWNTVNASYA